MNCYVSTTGNDTAKGTLEDPFQTLARAAANLEPGDTCYVREGVYRETLSSGSSGRDGQPITFRAYGDETALISSGEPLTDWRREQPEQDGFGEISDGDSLWSARLPEDLGDENQLFFGDRMLSEARWPKESGDLFAPNRAKADDGTEDSLIDPNLPGESNAWDNSILWCAGGAKWICWAGEVTGYDPASHTLSFSSDQTQKKFYTPCEGSEYVIMGARWTLSERYEWWVDRVSQRVWIVLPNDYDPDADSNKVVVEAKARRSVIDLSGLSHIHLDGLHFRGGGIKTDESSRNHRFENLHGQYLAHSFVRDVSDHAILIDGEGHIIIGCDFGLSSGSVLKLKGRNSKLLGNHIHHGNYGGLWKGTVALSGRRHVFTRNTVRHSGRDLLSIHGLTESLIEYNDLSHAGWLTHDLGITYGHNTDFGGTMIRRNWVHDCVAKGLAEGIYFDHCSHNVIVYENLIWNIPAMPIQINNPSYFNLVAHNSCYETNLVRPAITSFDHSHRQDMHECHFLNNLVNGPFDLPENATVAGNVVIRNPAYPAPLQGDFRLSDDTNDGYELSGIPGLRKTPATVAGAIQDGDESWSAGVDSGPEDESVEWHKPNFRYTNRLVNAAFELGTTEGWLDSGQVTVVAGNGWGNHVAGNANAPTGTSFFELELAGDATVEQRVSDLPANTRFSLSAWVRADRTPVTLLAKGSGIEPVETTTEQTEWSRIELTFETGAGELDVVVQISQSTTDQNCKARVDNLGLIEAM